MAEAVKVAQLYAEFDARGLKETQSSLNGVESTLGRVKGLLATVVSGFALKKLSSDFVKAAQSAENYRTSIRAVSDSIKEADKSYDRIRSWAESNPVDTDEAIGAFVRLKTAAVNNTEEALQSVADLSSVMQMDMRDVADSIVSAQAISLRRMGILLNQAGKKAIIESNGIRKEVNKDIASIRQGIIDVMKEAYGGSMDKARNNYQGILDTMGGMWTGFKQKVMEGANGPFETLKVKLGDIRDRWDAWMKTDDFDKLVNTLQGNLLSAINSAESAAKGLFTALKWASEHMNDLVVAAKALIAMKLTAWIINVTKALVAMNTALLASPALWAALAIGGISFLVFRDNMKAAEKQAKATGEAVSKAIETIGGATTKSGLEVALKAQKDVVSDLEKQLESLDKKITGTRGASRGGGGRSSKALNDVRSLKKEREKIASALEAESAAFAQIEKALNDFATGGVTKKGAGPGGSVSDTGAKGKSAAEKLVENIRDQMKYLSADGNSFVGVLDKWLAKLKPLSSDWKVIKDLVNDIYSQTIQEDSSKADRVLERIEREKQAVKDQAEMMKNANSEYLADLTWRNQQGLLVAEDYYNQTKALWEETKSELEGQSLDLSNISNWTQELREQFAAVQSAAVQLVSPALEELRKKYDEGKLSLQQYTYKVNELVAAYAGLPLVAEAGAEGIKSATENMKQGIIDLTELTKQWIQDFQSGIADAIVDGEGFADTLTNIGKEIEKMILKLLLFGKDGSSGWLGGIGSWFMSIFGHHSGGIIGSDSPTFTRQVELPKFHGGGIVGAGEELAVLKKGEGVFTEAQMDALGDMGGIGKIEVNVDVTNNGSGGNMTEKQADQLGRTIREVVKAEVTNSLYDYARSGMLRTA